MNNRQTETFERGANAGGQRSPSVYVGPCEFGVGVFAGRDFAAGEFILTWVGDTLDFASSVSLGERECYLLQIGPDLYLDAEAPARFLNHSCNPNSGFRGGIDLHALGPILAGEEIRFDYSTTMSERHWTMECRCGAHCCRGIVRDFHDLPEDVREKHLALGIVSPFIVEEARARRGSSLGAVAGGCLFPQLPDLDGGRFGGERAEAGQTADRGGRVRLRSNP